MNDYYTMMVCENGHVITDELENSSRGSAFCDECGAPTITACQKCGTPIRGDLIDSGVVVIGFTSSAPKYCHNCGQPYPWTSRSIEALKELAGLDDSLTAEDVDGLTNSAKDLMSETPRTKIAALKFKKILSRAGKETASAARDLFVDIVVETAKRTIWPN